MDRYIRPEIRKERDIYTDNRWVCGGEIETKVRNNRKTKSRINPNEDR